MHESKLFGNYRAKVVDNKDPQKFGRVLVWIPDIMPLVQDNEGIWARPANNPVGGRNMEDNKDNWYAGTSFIPRKGSWVWIFFEGGNINRPYYWSALDLENTTVLPENQLGNEYQHKWTILKSSKGRTIIVSDDPGDERVEITGKKRELKNPPTGDTDSVYKIDGNQTTILLDERDGKEKLLIRTRKGDFFHVDIDQQQLQAYFEKDIIIKTKGSFLLTAEEDIHIKAKVGNINITAESGDINEKSSGRSFRQSGSDSHNLSGGNYSIQAGSEINEKAGGNVNIDGANTLEQCGASGNSDPATVATDANPKGGRDE